MKTLGLFLLTLALPLALLGCGSGPAGKQSGTKSEQNAGKSEPPQAKEAKIQANLAKLSSEDRKLAEAQKYCAIETENRLGSMGKPFKVEVKGQPVFLCCEGCKKRALASPDKTLETVKELKARAVASPSK